MMIDVHKQYEDEYEYQHRSDIFDAHQLTYFRNVMCAYIISLILKLERDEDKTRCTVVHHNNSF